MTTLSGSLPGPRLGSTLVRSTSLVVTPGVVAHRGASGYRPEHTIDAYRLAIAMGADDIELDLVMTADGALIARHENELSDTTDVADRPDFAARRTTRTVDGRERTGWFSEDFTLAEVKSLAARERFRDVRPANVDFDATSGVPTLNEVLAMVQAESTRRGRSIGVMAELKHCAYFAARGLPVADALLADLARHDVDHPRSRVRVMSFERGILRTLAGRTTVPLVQLLWSPDRRPPDAGDDPIRYADMMTRAGLAEVESYADGIGAHVDLVLPRDGAGCVGRPSTLVRDAHREWLTVHAWTVRAENHFLPTNLRSGEGPGGLGDVEGYARLLLDAGVDGLITDHPDLALAARAAWLG